MVAFLAALTLALVFMCPAFRKVDPSSDPALAVCGQKLAFRPGARIVNGDDASDCEWRWQAQLRNKFFNGQFCGGSLIAPEWVLTAAHCTVAHEDYDGGDLEIVFGNYNKSAPRRQFEEQSVVAAEIVNHPEYNIGASFHSDLALIRLSRPVRMTACVGTICLPSAGHLAAGTRCWITGWGDLFNDGYRPELLQEASVNAISTKDCANNLGYNSSWVDETMFCAQGKIGTLVTDACQADSGGPLVCESKDRQWTLYGVTSWGLGCGDTKYPGVYANVNHHLDWIQDVFAGNYQSTERATTTTTTSTTTTTVTIDAGACPAWCRWPLCVWRAECKLNCPVCQR